MGPALRAKWDRQLPALYDELKADAAGASPNIGGWSYSKPNIGNFGADDRYRSIVALGGLAAFPPGEAVYVTAVSDSKGAPLDGRSCYTLTLPPKVPVRAFWSLSMYRLEADGQLFFAANPIARYSIGNRTANLASRADGSIEIAIQATQPNGAANWLPAPSGPFRMTFRAYLPHPGARLTLPPIVRRTAVQPNGC
jgi:hypothetical protein